MKVFRFSVTQNDFALHNLPQVILSSNPVSDGRWHKALMWSDYSSLSSKHDWMQLILNANWEGPQILLENRSQIYVKAFLMAVFDCWKDSKNIAAFDAIAVATPREMKNWEQICCFCVGFVAFMKIGNVELRFLRKIERKIKVASSLTHKILFLFRAFLGITQSVIKYCCRRFSLTSTRLLGIKSLSDVSSSSFVFLLKLLVA